MRCVGGLCGRKTEVLEYQYVLYTYSPPPTHRDFTFNRRIAPLALVRRFCLEAAGYAVAGYRWLSPASFSSTLIVCPRP
eukprot:COSAG05_NODE_1359_length_5097_cov_2.531813_5_plen_79_part_00